MPDVVTPKGNQYTMKIFGLEITRNYWLFIIWIVFSVLAYVLCMENPDSAYFEQLCIKTRNIALFMVALYMLRKFELVRIPVQQNLIDGLKQSSSPNFGYALIAMAIYYGLCISALGAVIIGGQ